MVCPEWYIWIQTWRSLDTQKMIPDVFSAMECMASPSRLGAANKACQKLQKRSVKKESKRTK